MLKWIKGHKKPQPQFFFDDQMLILHLDGTVDNKPKGHIYDCYYIQPQDCDPRNQRAFEKDFTGLLLDFDVKGYAEYLGLHYNDCVAPKARMLWLLNKVITQMPRENLGMSYFTVPEEESKIRGGMRAYLALSLFKHYDPDQFINEMQQATTHEDAATRNVAQVFMQNLALMETPEAEAFAKAEVAHDLQRCGMGKITPTGTGKTPLCPDDIEQARQVIQANIEALRADIPAAVKDIRQKMGRTSLTSPNQTIMERILALPAQAAPGLGILYDLALQNDELGFMLTSGPSCSALISGHTCGLSLAGYSAPRNTVYTPKSGGKTRYTVAEAMGREVEGAFAFLNTMDSQANFGMEREAKKRESCEDSWKEELLHAAFQRLFLNHCLPYPAGGGELHEHLLNAALHDFTTSESLRFEVSGSLLHSGVSYKSVVKWLEGLEPDKRRNVLDDLLKEMIVKVTLEADKYGWAAGYDMGPELCRILQQEILPCAKERCAELHVAVTPRQPHHLVRGPEPVGLTPLRF